MLFQLIMFSLQVDIADKNRSLGPIFLNDLFFFFALGFVLLGSLLFLNFFLYSNFREFYFFRNYIE